MRLCTCTYAYTYVCMYVCMYACMYVRLFVCMYVRLCIDVFVSFVFLQLLMCGVQKMDPIDMKENTEVRGSDARFLRMVDWFWKVVIQFSQEELARLVQFITGSSQIPIGGFAELKPRILIVHASGEASGRLPYAHTWLVDCPPRQKHTYTDTCVHACMLGGKQCCLVCVNS